MTSQHVELAFNKAKELVAGVCPNLPAEMMSHSLLETVFVHLVQCDDDAKPSKIELKEAA